MRDTSHSILRKTATTGQPILLLARLAMLLVRRSRAWHWTIVSSIKGWERYQTRWWFRIGPYFEQASGSWPTDRPSTLHFSISPSPLHRRRALLRRDTSPATYDPTDGLRSRRGSPGDRDRASLAADISLAGTEPLEVDNSMLFRGGNPFRGSTASVRSRHLSGIATSTTKETPASGRVTIEEKLMTFPFVDALTYV